MDYNKAAWRYYSLIGITPEWWKDWKEKENKLKTNLDKLSPEDINGRYKKAIDRLKAELQRKWQRGVTIWLRQEDEVWINILTWEVMVSGPNTNGIALWDRMSPQMIKEFLRGYGQDREYTVAKIKFT